MEISWCLQDSFDNTKDRKSLQIYSIAHCRFFGNGATTFTDNASEQEGIMEDVIFLFSSFGKVATLETLKQISRK